ncbi:polysaccharide pyruvyl transferase family protein [Arthrobacter sp. S41]|uniref:polysaccharide pyruvyl transferase family protein n=1 Tax=Arthrobacter sp. S41 TaxID=2509721 RepID=UPI001A91615F|nr:polysaccharide pyruvyl transferase family protein [Arthrobacter sp. S41]
MDPKNKYDVAVLGWWYGKNYGSILTYYGLNRAIENLGHSVLMVHEPVGYNGFRVQWPNEILSMDFARRTGYEYTDQLHYSDLDQLNELAETFVVGSDQLWNPLIGRVNDDLFLDFVAPDRNRVAYGTSFGNRGTDKFKPDFVEKHSQNLQKFKAISVRENYAVKTASDIFGVKADLVVDPVFLLDQEHYSKLASKASISPEGEYLAVFLLDPTEEKKSTAVAILEKTGLDKILVICNPDEGRSVAEEIWSDEPRAEIIAADSPENFLRAYKDASYVVTDSFHGTAFSVIFEKPFSSIYNNKRGADRFKNLLASLGFGDTRRVYESDTTETVNENPNVTRTIDFTKARTYITKGRKTSLEWLKAALDPTVKSTAALENGKAVTAAAAASKNSHTLDLDFSANSDVWSIDKGAEGVSLSVVKDKELRGKHVWTNLPEPLTPGSKKRIKIQWTPTTQTKSINVHLRNPESGTFRVIGKAAVAAGSGGLRTDEFEFSVAEPGLSQIMLGALHFTGPKAGAQVHEISISDAKGKVPAPSAPAAKKSDEIVEGFSKQARRLANHDFEQQVRSFTRGRSADSVTGIRARMFFHAHAIEKGLTHSNFRPGFGRIAIPGLAKEMNAWLSRGLGTDDTIVQSSASVMKAYFARNEETNTDVSHFRNLFSVESQEVIAKGQLGEGGAFPASKHREDPVETPNDDRAFMEVVYGRRSVREFNDTPVDDSAIASAVQIAMQSPSVCSRQGARVHQFDDPEIIKQLLEVQGGFFGFNAPPRLLLVTADLDAFLFAPERNQPFVDGGLFMMSLLLGLTQMELGSCLLNTAMGVEKEQKIRNIVDLPENEVFIAFVAVGNFDQSVLVPRSKRVEADSILKRHG